MKKAHLICFLVCGAILVSGCPLSGSKPPVITYNGKLNVSAEGFQMEGQVENQEAVSDPTRFENVTVYLYTANESLIRSVSIGTLDRRAKISVTTKQIPEYIIISSARTLAMKNIVIDYYTRVDEGPGNYTVDTANSRQDLPVQPS